MIAEINTLYQYPPEPIKSMAESELAPVIKINTEASKAFLLHRRPHKLLSELANPELKLAGLRINPANNMASREAHYYRITLLDIELQKESTIKGLPENGKFCRLAWNYKQDKALTLNIEADGVQAWLIDVINCEAVPVGPKKVNGNLGQSFMWLKNDGIILLIVPDNTPAYKSTASLLPTGPVIAQNDGQAIESRTFQDLLKNEIDVHNFETAVTSELWMIDAGGDSLLWKESAMYDGMSLSPDGNMILISEIKKPFSYFVPFDRFPYHTYVTDLHGARIKTIEEAPLLEYIPQGFMAVQQGKRMIKWRPNHASTLVWAEALDGGDPEKECEFRDALFEWQSPFEEEPKEFYKTKLRYAGIFYTDLGKAVLFERWWKNRQQITKIFTPEHGHDEIIFDDRNFQDRFNDPGNFVTRKNNFGWNTIFENEAGEMYLSGDGYYADGRRPFLDKYNLKSGHKQRLFEVDDSLQQEDIVMVVDAEKGKLITLIQDSYQYPNFFIRNLSDQNLKSVTQYKNPFEALAGVKQEVLQYQRADGTDLTARLYLPANADENQLLPLVMWAYPMEYKDKQTAGQNTASRHEFIYPFWGSPIYWVTRGYAVMDDVSFPVIGEGESQPNDHFHEQMLANAEAAIDVAKKTGRIDSARIGIGGHSYGAFMVAYLLTHTQYFAAGIARSGAYNRTLTPFGFQSEERNLWQAKNVYTSMNPFLDAEKMKSALLLIHGQEDNNSGTYTMQTERYYAALKALGATVRMVLLPYESHSYQAKESILHVLWEQDTWLEKYVKNKA